METLACAVACLGFLFGHFVREIKEEEKGNNMHQRFPDGL